MKSTKNCKKVDRFILRPLLKICLIGTRSLIRYASMRNPSVKPIMELSAPKEDSPCTKVPESPIETPALCVSTFHSVRKEDNPNTVANCTNW